MNTDNSYWQERFTALMDAQNKKGDKYIAELQKLFTKLMGALEGDIAKWYRRFAKDNSVSYTDAQKILSGKELQELKWQVDEYIRIAKQQNNEVWLKKLQNASSRVHISRLESLQIQMQAQIEELFEGKIQTGVASTLEDIYTDTYYQSAFNVQLGIGEGFDIAKVDKSKLKTVLSAPWSADGSNFSDRIWSNKVNLLNNLQQQLALNTVRGDGVDKMTAAMQKALNTSRYNAERVVRTEVAYVGSLAENNCMKEIGVREYRIVATLDNRTSSICAGLDGKVFKQSEYKAGITAPPFHPNCRSCTIPNVKARGSRTARGADGKNYDVPADMTYPEWKKKYLYDAASDKEQNLYKQYKKILGNNSPKTFDEFSKIHYNVDDYRDLRAYTNGIKNGKISPLVDFELYQRTAKEVNRRLVGFATSDGNVVQSVSKHFIERVLGSVVEKRSGVDVDTVLDTLKHPVKIIECNRGNQKSLLYKGKDAGVTLNPETGNLIQCNPLNQYKERKDD